MSPAAGPTVGTRTQGAPPTLLRDRVVVTVAAVVWLVGTAIGSGWFGGGGVQSQGEGLFSDTATLIAPAGPAFSIWLVIYLGLLGYTIWQWLPASDDSAWARVTRLPAAASMALNGLWLLVVFADQVLLSVLVMAAIVISLGIILRRTALLAPEGWPATVLVAGTFGLYLGWICVATCANIASWLVGLGVDPATSTSAWITVAVLVAVLAIVAWLLSRTAQPVVRGALAATATWGVAWTAVGRLTGELRSDLVGYAALLTAVLLAGLGVASVVLAARRAPSAPRHAGVPARGEVA